MGLNAETPPPPPKSRGNSLKQFFQRPPSSSGTFRYPSPAASMASPSPKQAVYHPMAHYQQSSGRTPHSYTPPMTRAASMPSPPHMQHQGPGIPLSSATTASPVAPARQPMHGGYYGSTPSLSSVSSFDYYPSPTQYQHAPMYSTPQRQQPQPPVLYEQQQHGQWMNSAYSLPMDSSHQHQQRQQRQYYHQQQLPPQQILAASSLSLYNSTTAQYTAGLHNNVAAPMPQPPQSQTKEAVLKLEISSRNLLVEEAARDVLISPLKEVLQIVHCNEANVSPVMFSPGLSHYKPLYVWEMDPSVPPYNYKEHSEMALKVDKDLPPLQLLSPIRGTATSNGLTSKVSLAELYVSLSDIQLDHFEVEKSTLPYTQEPTTVELQQLKDETTPILRAVSQATVAHSIQDSGVSLSSFNLCEDSLDDNKVVEEEELFLENESDPPTPVPKSPLHVDEITDFCISAASALSLNTTSKLSVNTDPVISPTDTYETQSFISCSENVNSSRLPSAESSPNDFYYPYPLDSNGEPMDLIQKTLARVPSPVTSSSSTGSRSTVSEDTTMNRSPSAISVAEDGYRPSFLTLRKRQHAIATAQVGEGAKIVPFERTIDMYRRNCVKTNDPEVQFEFAQFCIKAGDRYIDEGLAWLKRLSQSGFSKAQYFLGLAYADDGRYDLAFRQFLQAAKRSHIESTYEVAKLSENGAKGISRNKKRALEYFTKAASAGHAKAMFRLAMAELHGELGLRVNVQNAMKWLDRGASIADEDCPEPVFELSLIYETGSSPFLLADPYHSRTLLIEAAELQYAPALYKLATCFETGINGFPVNQNESIKLYCISSNSGYAPSQLAFAGWLLTGLEGVLEKNTEEAFYWAYQAAAQKHARAEYTVGYFLELGIGLAPDMAKALRWYVAAAKRSDELAIKRLKELNVLVPVDTSSVSYGSHKKSTLFGFNIGS